MNRILLPILFAFIINNLNAQVSDTSLQGFMPYKFGASISASRLKTNLIYRGLVQREFSSITPENAMKFATIHPSQNTYSWADADTIVAFALANNKRMHGHCLVWYNSIPNWVTNFVGDSAAWENLLKTHIDSVVAHFKGKLTSWDVVNEAIADDGTRRSTIWSQHLGPGYIARAFQYAHAADPNALLFYNDYNHESSSNNFAKLIAIQGMVDSLVAAGIPINGVGLQMHVNIGISNANIERAIDSMLTTGLLIHISELDVAVNPGNSQALTYNSNVADQQFDKFKFFSRIVKSIPANQFYGITTWDVSDADSWIPGTYSRPDYPLEFDSSYQKKSSFQGLKDGATTLWTNTASSGQSIAGTYTDLGTNGTPITTGFTGNGMGSDNDNSSVQNIGFNFLYNGTNYTNFVLNTNGFIKMGVSAPTSNAIFYAAYNSNTGSVITTSDIDLTYPYNHDLKSGTSTSAFRVYTSGDVGSRVCTIQFKSMADKLAPIQYTNLEFQIKLYETSNTIEFIYGNWTASTNTSTSITAAVGIKGINATESINISKASGTAWNAGLGVANSYTFISGDYAAAGPQFNTRNTFLPDAGRTFRFTQTASILPVTLLSFSAIPNNKNVLLNWSTTNEINNKNFEIQRSIDGTNFTTIGITNAIGNNSGLNNNYEFTDNSPSTSSIYYRLKQNDIDEKFNYSAIIKVSRNNIVSFDVTVINPFTNSIQMQLQSALQQAISVTLINTNGQILLNKELNIQAGVNAVSLATPTISTGIYYLKIVSKSGEKIIKILKQ